MPDRAESPAARFTPVGRLAAAGTLVVGATFQVVAFALIPDFDKTVDRLEWIAAHDTQAQISKTADLLAVPFLVAGVVVYDAVGSISSASLGGTGSSSRAKAGCLGASEQRRA